MGAFKDTCQNVLEKISNIRMRVRMTEKTFGFSISVDARSKKDLASDAIKALRSVQHELSVIELELSKCITVAPNDDEGFPIALKRIDRDSLKMDSLLLFRVPAGFSKEGVLRIGYLQGTSTEGKFKVITRGEGIFYLSEKDLLFELVVNNINEQD